MHSSRLVILLKSLTKREFRQLEKFLHSPLHNQNEEVKLLYHYLKENNHHPNYSSPQLNKEIVDKAIFGVLEANYEYHPRRIRDLMSKLSLLVNDFMIYLESQREDNWAKDRLLLQALGRRDLYPLFVNKTKELIDNLDKQPLRNAGYYQIMYELNQAWYVHPHNQKMTTTDDKLLQATMSHLDRFYILNKLRLSCEIATRHQLLSRKNDFDLIEEVLTIAKTKYSDHEVLFGIYSHILELLSEGYNHELFQTTKALFFSHLDHVEKEERRIILLYLINIISSSINLIDKGIHEVFSLYKLGIEHGVLIIDNTITAASYTNIAVLGSKLEDFDWTLNFIEKYEKCLDKSIRKDTKLVSLAYWHFNKKEFNETIKLIRRQHYPEKFFNIRTRSLLLRAFFEQSLTEKDLYGLLQSECESFRKFIARDKNLSSNKKIEYKNFCKLITRMARLLNDHIHLPIQKVKKLKKEIEEKEALVTKGWLLEKVTELEKKAR